MKKRILAVAMLLVLCVGLIPTAEAWVYIKGEACLGFNDSGAVTIPDYVIGISEVAFMGSDITSVTIPNSVTRIGAQAFQSCKGLTSVTIPDSVTSIEHGVFAHCTGLTSVTIPDSVTSIGDYAFRDCVNLTTVTIPDSVTSIGEYAFYCCDSLTSVTIPDSVTGIDGKAFNECSSLERIIYQGSKKEWKTIRRNMENKKYAGWLDKVEIDGVKVSSGISGGQIIGILAALGIAAAVIIVVLKKRKNAPAVETAVETQTTILQKPEEQEKEAEGNRCACGAMLAPGAKFCNACGAPVARKGQCPNCGAQNDPTAKFCSSCGTALEK